jgi:hypothetical protein
MFFAPLLGQFSTYVRTGVDKEHMGLEGAIEWKPLTSWVFTGAVNAGYYHYTSRPLLYASADNTGLVSLDSISVYQKNLLVPRTPQTTANLGLKYEGKQFWFASLSLNWADNFWFNFDPTRRRAESVLGLEPGSSIWNTIINQRKAPAAYTLDFYGGKSWKINKIFLNLNIGVNNILDNKNIIVSGREAYLTSFGREFDNEQLYSHEVQYAPGLNYFISLGVRM